MVFTQVIETVASALLKTGTTIDPNNYDGVIVKKLEASNTLDDGRTTNQTHIAITGSQMDIFPYLRSDGYFNDATSDTDLKKYYITQIPLALHKSNVEYLDDSQTDIHFDSEIKSSYTSVVRSKRKSQADQIQVSLINFDGPDFVAFRKMLHSGSYLVILKLKQKFEYEAYGLVPNRGIESDGGLQALNNQFSKLATNTTVNVSSFLGMANTSNNFESNRLTTGENVLLYGVPGSGKSWTIEHEYCKPGSIVERLVFHPDYTYSDFIGQILPAVAEDGQVSYKFTPGPFTNILREAYNNPGKEYILIIEEINRGNAPAIFGEVFQLLDRKVEIRDIDDDGFPVGTSEYGITNMNIAEEMYGKDRKTDKVRIPSNLSIIGTMNTSDQNVFTLDTAFQRRWDMRLIDNDFANVDSTLADEPILDTKVTWKNFCVEINKIVVGNSARMTSAEDKRLGVYFVHLRDLKFNDAMGDLKEYDELREKESKGTLTTEEKTQIAVIRDAMRQNRKFPEKVIKYLWDDAFKFNREVIFEVTEYQSLEQVIRAFMYAEGLDRFKVFKDNVQSAFTGTEEV